MADWSEWITSRKNLFQGQILWDESLSKHTYYRIGGPAKLMFIPTSKSDLEWIHEFLKDSNAPFFILGLGSNLLVSDGGFSGVVIKTTRIDIGIHESQKLESFSIETGASVANSSLLRRAAQEGWSGLDFLVGIPGSIGGAIWMNAGTLRGESAANVLSVATYKLISGTYQNYSGDELKYEYRKNKFLSSDEVVLSAVWKVKKEGSDQVKKQIDDLMKRRKATQPVDFPSCGSVFKNPPGQSAWQIIEKLGLRGFKKGNAQISEKHANFIVNLGGAKASDVFYLIQTVKAEAKKKLGLEMHEEVRYLGDF